jgi:hypothetical protein
MFCALFEKVWPAVTVEPHYNGLVGAKGVCFNESLVYNK